MARAGAGVRSSILIRLAMQLVRWKKCAMMVLLAIWAAGAYIFLSFLRCSTEEVAALQARLRTISARLDLLRHQISKNKKDEGPSLEYETLRRRIYTNTKELWYYVSHELEKAINHTKPTEILRDLLEQAGDRKRLLLADQQRLASADGHAEWRTREANEVSALVQRRLRALQHPANCDTAKKIVCDLNKACGFGCQIHNIAYCLIFAYATERTLLLVSNYWMNSQDSWETFLIPLNNCTELQDTNKNSVSTVKVVNLPPIDYLKSRVPFLPLAIPKDLAERIARFNGDPASWWVGQMMRYILRPQPKQAMYILDWAKRLNYSKPIVGIHVRRTDKLYSEADFHGIHEYMQHVNEYWSLQDLISGTPVPRRIYLATDDYKLMNEAREAYPNIEFIGSNTALLDERYTAAGLISLLLDVTLLAQTDHLVCTFSSQVGRMAYELMQANRPDASESVFSLDDIYYFGGQNPHDRIALMPHTTKNSKEIAFKEGDIIGVAGNHWNGYGLGRNRRTHLNGLWPWYKTADHLVLYSFPTYDKVPKKEPPTAGHKSPTPVDLANLFSRDISLYSLLKKSRNRNSSTDSSVTLGATEIP